ncbi:MAG: arginine--tRNA ligase [Cytophagales bacterium]|nr:arginine--tRNA ligase [Cytophagales bacterium]
MLRVQSELLSALQSTLDKLLTDAGLPPSVTAQFESPKVAAHGDLAITSAMQLSKTLKANPRALGETMKAALEASPAFAKWAEPLEIAGPGFINIRLKPAAKQTTVTDILQSGMEYGSQSMRAAQSPPDKACERLLVEFVSANPTGPLHVGHGRQAALGDAICNLFATQGVSVYREFYYNDAGVQIDTLTKSTQLRAKGFKPGDACWPIDPENPASKAFYNGEYIADIARDYLATGNSVDDAEAIRTFAVAYLRHEQDLDLSAFRVKFDNFYLESSLYASGRVEAAVNKLIAAGKTYEQDGALWLKSTEYGDDKDRVMRKSALGGADGRKSSAGESVYTYFVPDVAYHIAKWERGFTRVINIQGTDHHGTIARVRAGLQAANVGIPVGYPDYVLHTMVRVIKNGEEVKISKRAGSYVTLRDLIEWTSADAVRFFLLSRKPDTEYTFDVDLAVKKNNDNPVFYVQYAHARIRSILRTYSHSQVGEMGDVAAPIAALSSVDLSPLDSPAAQALMLQLAKYPAMLTEAAKGFAPHDVTFYLRDLASSYHSYYDAERILVDDVPTKLARLALIAATAQVLRNGLAVLGVSAPEKM